MEVGTQISERYNPITGVSIPTQTPRTNTSAIFGGSTGPIEYMFIPPTGTTRATLPNATDKRRSPSKENIKLSETNYLPDSHQDSTILQDLIEYSEKVENCERKTSFKTNSKTPKSIARSTSSRLPISATRPTVMKRAHSFTRETDSCIPRGQSSSTDGFTNNQEQSNSSSDARGEPVKSGEGFTSNIPKKSKPRMVGVKSTSIPQQKARNDVNFNTGIREKTDKENINKGATAIESKWKQKSTSGIPIKGGTKIQKNSRKPTAAVVKKEEGEKEETPEQKKSTLKDERTKDKKTTRNNENKSKLPRKPSTFGGHGKNITQTCTLNKQNKKISKPDEALERTHTKLTSQSKSTTESVHTLNTLPQNDLMYGYKDSIRSKEDASFSVETCLSRENSKSKIPVMTRKNRIVESKMNRDNITGDVKTSIEKEMPSISSTLERPRDKKVYSMMKNKEHEKNEEVIVEKGKAENETTNQQNFSLSLKDESEIGMKTGEKCMIKLDNEKPSSMMDNGRVIQTTMDNEGVIQTVMDNVGKIQTMMDNAEEKKTSKTIKLELDCDSNVQNKETIQTLSSMKHKLQAKKITVKQSTKKPPHLSKIMMQNTEHKTESNQINTKINSEDSSTKDASNNKKDDTIQSSRIAESVESVESKSFIKYEKDKVNDDPEMSKLMDKEKMKSEEINDEMGGNMCEDVSRPVRSDNCMQCRMEQSINDDENLPNIRDDPGFRQYPTFISPRKSLIMCKHHANETTAMDEVCVEYIQNEEIKSKYEILGNKTMEIIPQKNVCFENGNSKKSNGTEEIKMDFGKSEMDFGKCEGTEGIKMDFGKSKMDFGKCEGTEGIKMDFMKSEGTEGINMDLEKSKGTEAVKTDFGKSEGTEEMKMDLQKSDTKEMMIGKDSKGSLSPLFALSRDKKFVSTDKPIAEDIKTAPSLEWDDIGTELSPPNVSDEDIDENGQKDEQNDMKKSSIKLMNTNEALDKLKVIQNLIMKEAESRSRKDLDENDVKHVNISNQTGKEVHMKHENEVEALSQTEDSRRPLSPTIWDRIANNSTMSQHQTTELLNETLAKLKASPKFDESSFVKSTFNTRSLPRSTQTSKKQISIDGEKPVCVYTSNWIGTGSKNSRGSLQNLRSSHHSLPNSRHNLTSMKEPAIKQLENTAGHMDSKEQLESTKVMVASFEEINLSDGLNVHKPKNDVMHKDKLPSNDDKAHKKSTKDSKIKTKNTVAATNGDYLNSVSLDDLTAGKTRCQCGGKKCIIS